jgi:hypothetical protein
MVSEQLRARMKLLGINPEHDIPIEVLVGVTLKTIRNDNNTIVMFSTDGDTFTLEHSQDCCESVVVEDICGDLDDLIGTPITMVEEVVNPPGASKIEDEDGYGAESFTWTFYKLGTSKGSVTIRFYGTSNGYYSERVDFNVS